MAKGVNTADTVGVDVLALAVGVATALAMPTAPVWGRFVASDLAETDLAWP